jgi:peroxiredoxin
VAGHDVYTLPDDLPVPKDDGACDGLESRKLPDLSLTATTGGQINLAGLGDEGTAVLFVYPRTGRPDQPLPQGWDLIPGARGCTPQSCAFRDLHGEFEARGVSVTGLSAQCPEDQLEFTERVHLQFPLLSDADLELAAALGLPTFEAAGMTLYKRVTLVIRDGEIVKVFYPVFPPDRNAVEVLSWLSGGATRGSAGTAPPDPRPDPGARASRG